MNLKTLLLLSLSLCASAQVFAHGLMESPASRNWICGATTKPDQVTNGTAATPACGTAFATNPIAGYSFMSVLTHAQGRSVVNPLPTHVCSFGSETWNGAQTPWDVPMDWPAQPMASGLQTITWNISWGPHFDDTAEFRYWITKADFQFSPSKALTWDDFETAPFCVLSYDDKNPNANPAVTTDKANARFHTQCTVPQRNGHHVIYGEWGRLPPTYERFHGCIDAAFSGTPPTPVVARINSIPAVSDVTGATSIHLSAANSQGDNLSYNWSVESANPALYSLSNTNSQGTSLSLQNPQAETLFKVQLRVSDGVTSSTATQSFHHYPSIASSWMDLGALSNSPVTRMVGEGLRLRLVDDQGVDSYLPPYPVVLTSATNAANAWPLALAQAINASNSEVQIGVLANNLVSPSQSATANRIYATVPNNYVGAYLAVAPAGSGSSSSALSSSSLPSSSSSSANNSGAQCNWYGSLYPLCVTTQSGWGWEANRNCISRTTCAAQPAPYGVVEAGASSSSSSNSSAPGSASSSNSSSSSVPSSSAPTSSASSSASSAVGSNCSYVVTNEWNTGFTAVIRIRNNGPHTMNTWSVNWGYSDGSLITNSWNATLSGSNPYSATGLNWNSTIQPGQQVEFGFQGTKGSGTSAQVATVSGSVCQ